MAPISRLDITTINLNRLLSRLDERLPPLTHRSYPITPSQSLKAISTTEVFETGKDKIPNAIERRKIAANLEYARKLLLQLETEYAAVKDARVRKKVAEDVRRWKGWIRGLNERCQVLEEMEVEDREMGSENREKTEDTPNKATALESESGILRNRLNKSSTSSDLITTSITQSGKKPELFGDKTVSTNDANKVLTAQSATREDYTNALVRMGSLLKERFMALGKGLEDDISPREQVAQGLDKVTQRMETTGGRMEVLRKDSRVGWYKQLVYLISIAGLMLFCLIMLMLPKLRM